MYTTLIQVSATDHPKPALRGIDHVQLAMPPGGEDRARQFYTGVLARKAHPALLVDALPAFVDRAALAFTWATDVPGLVHGDVDDPFGNRIELVDAHGSTRRGASASERGR